MRIPVIFFLFALPCLCFSQKKEMKNFGELPEPTIKKFEIQLQSGLLLDKFRDFITNEVSVNYLVSDAIYAGAGLMYANQDFYDLYSPYGTITFKSSEAKIAPYGKIICGANFSTLSSSKPGIYFAIGAGVQYAISKKLGVAAELTHKSYSLYVEPDNNNYTFISSGERNRIYYSYFTPSLGVSWKF